MLYDYVNWSSLQLFTSFKFAYAKSFYCVRSCDSLLQQFVSSILQATTSKIGPCGYA